VKKAVKKAPPKPKPVAKKAPPKRIVKKAPPKRVRALKSRTSRKDLWPPHSPPSPAAGTESQLLESLNTAHTPWQSTYVCLDHRTPTNADVPLSSAS